MTGMGDDMSIAASKVDCCMLEQCIHEYHITLVLSLQVPFASLSVLDAPPGKTGFYL